MNEVALDRAWYPTSLTSDVFGVATTPAAEWIAHVAARVSRTPSGAWRWEVYTYSGPQQGIEPTREYARQEALKYTGPLMHVWSEKGLCPMCGSPL